MAAKLLIPVTFIFGAMPVTGFWLDADEVQSMLLGLALIASMPTDLGLNEANSAWM